MTVSLHPSLLEQQLDQLQGHWPGATLQAHPGAAGLVHVAALALPAGWNMAQTAVWFLAPTGYPVAQPDCFWADSSLLLANGAAPTASGLNEVPHLSGVRRWFSWHIRSWNPLTDSLVTYVRVIQTRFDAAT